MGKKRNQEEDREVVHTNNQDINNKETSNPPTENDSKTTNDFSEEEENLKEKSTFFGKKNTKEAKLKEKITQLEVEKEELNERYLRLFSEFDNYKKRTAKEKLDLLATASETVISYLLPVIDDFERAIQANQKVENIDSVKEGFKIIYKKTLQILKQFNVEEIPAINEPFDTDLHEAVTHFPATNEEDKGKIMEVLSKGYKIHNKVIRFSKVVVAN